MPRATMPPLDEDRSLPAEIEIEVVTRPTDDGTDRVRLSQARRHTAKVSPPVWVKSVVDGAAGRDPAASSWHVGHYG